MGKQIVIPTGKQFGKRPWTPADMTTVMWYDAQDVSTITESAGKVSAWADKSGNANDTSQGTGSKQPTTNSRTMGTLNVLDFDSASNNTFQRGSVSHNNDFMIAIIMDVDGGTALYSENGSGSQAYIVETTRINFQSDTNISYAATLSGPEIVVLAVDWTGTIAEAFVNGTSEGTSTLTQAAGNGPASRVMNNFVGGSAADGGLGEIVIVNDITTATRQKLEGYLAWRWAQQALLPGGHPYVSERPIA